MNIHTLDVAAPTPLEEAEWFLRDNILLIIIAAAVIIAAIATAVHFARKNAKKDHKDENDR